jgi:hypothetical protein
MKLILIGAILIVVGYLMIFRINPDMPLEDVVVNVKLWNGAVVLGALLIIFHIVRRR